MDAARLWAKIIQETACLVKDAAHPERNTVRLSPEVAALLSRIDRGGQGEVCQGREMAPSVSAESAPVEDEVAAGLAALAEVVSQCTKCPLCKTRTQTVFSDGNPHAELVFVGEAPGAEEDWQGVPFVGAAGQLLTRIIEQGMKMDRRDVYICNVLKCRPPENRDPHLDEIEHCAPYLVRQLELIRPKVICALGGHAAKTLLKTSESTGRLRGTWHFYRGIPVRVTYHPAYLVRLQYNEKRFAEEKRKVWEDIQAVMRILSGKEDPRPAPGPVESGDLFD